MINEIELREFLANNMSVTAEQADIPYSLRKPAERTLEFGRYSAFRDVLNFFE